jgi:Na+-translocating ferredoxin:NAD+ oxidoreductase RnfD subunit
MRQYTPRVQGSLWTKGKVGIILGTIVIIGLLIWVPVIRWFLAISVVVGLIMAAIIHWWNEHHAVKPEDEGEIRLGLMDDEKKR